MSERVKSLPEFARHYGLQPRDVAGLTDAEFTALFWAIR